MLIGIPGVLIEDEDQGPTPPMLGCGPGLLSQLASEGRKTQAGRRAVILYQERRKRVEVRPRVIHDSAVESWVCSNDGDLA